MPSNENACKLNNLKCVLIDIDNTLLDFGKSSRLAIIRTCEDFNIAYPPQIFDVFVKVTNDMWRLIQDGKLTEARLRLIRWNAIFDELGISADGPAFEAIFNRHLKSCAVPVAGAEDILDYLHSKYLVCAASNAPYGQQLRRMKLANLAQYVDEFFVSEHLGAQKPNPAFFEACLNGLNSARGLDLKPQDLIMIGDDIHADMLGAASYAIRTCWYNPLGLPNAENIQIDITISCLSDVRSFI